MGERAPVLQVVTSTARRGAEVSAVQLGEALEVRNCPARTVALWPGRDASSLDLRALGRRRNDPRAALALAREARHASVVVGHGSSTLPFGALATGVARAPFVYRSIGDPGWWASTPVRRARVRIALRRARTVVALWPAAADALVERFGVARDRVEVIPNGVPAERARPTPATARPAARLALDADLDPDRPTVLLLGALSAEKNPLAAVEALAVLTDAQLLVAGEGPLASEVVARGTRVAPGRVHVVGGVADPMDVLAAADVLVLPSRTEGVPAVLVEAALAGLPVVASDVGGVGSVVVDGVTGRLVAGLTPFRLAAAIRDVLPAGEALGAVARARALERFTLDAVADRWAQLLGTVSAHA